MKHQRLLIAIAAALFVAPAAFAQIVTLVRAVELSPSNIIMPASVNGMVTFRPCAGECDTEYDRARLTAETQFVLDGKQVRFADFSRDFGVARKSRDGYALISVDTKTRTVKRIEISR